MRTRGVCSCLLAAFVGLVVVGCGPKEDDIPVLKGPPAPKSPGAPGHKTAPPPAASTKPSAKDFN